VTAFLDTNILVYAYDAADRAKQERAREVLGDGGWMISTQVMQEFFVVVTRRIATPLPADEALGILDDLASSEVAVLSADDVRVAAALSVSRQLSLWDSLILTAAGRAGCDRVVTEDLGHGDRIEGLLIENPFV
jgi:predicted nucleic acid-binding protein